MACAWIVVSLTVAERALGAPQAGETEKQEYGEASGGDEGTAEGERRRQDKNRARFQHTRQ